MSQGIKLSELAQGMPEVALVGDGEVLVRGLAYDSRRVQPGDLFAAIPGVRSDGRAFISQAVAAGAVAVLGQNLERAGVPGLQTPEVRKILGQIAGRFYGHPDHHLTLIGITGTNGKTTITYLLESILKKAGFRPGVIGTVNYRFENMTWPADNTTPESVDIFRVLSQMVEAGATHAVMEVSSHALDQKRVSGLFIPRTVFTNLSRDHLDYHGDLEEYYQAKRKLFTEVMTGKWNLDAPPAKLKPQALVNLDDAAGQRLFAELKGRGLSVQGYGIKIGSADFGATEIKITAEESAATLLTPAGRFRIRSRLLGRHNLENILAAVGVALSLGVSVEAVSAGVQELEKVPGRLEPVPNAAGITVLVDYAHTPDALAHAVQTCRELAPKRLITVFGCGGDRDRGKRPQMGRIGVQGSHLCVITSDNPRTEDPQTIINEILKGAEEVGRLNENYLVEPDRRQAIRLALNLAEPGDIVLIAGKGHEDYQILGTTKVHFDDREEVKTALAEKLGIGGGGGTERAH